MGYAWRKLRRDPQLQKDPPEEIIVDLHAELLQRLGLLPRPQSGRSPAASLQGARRDVILAADKLASLARRQSPVETHGHDMQAKAMAAQ